MPGGFYDIENVIGCTCIAFIGNGRPLVGLFHDVNNLNLPGGLLVSVNVVGCTRVAFIGNVGLLHDSNIGPLLSKCEAD